MKTWWRRCERGPRRRWWRWRWWRASWWSGAEDAVVDLKAWFKTCKDADDDDDNDDCDISISTLKPLVSNPERLLWWTEWKCNKLSGKAARPTVGQYNVMLCYVMWRLLVCSHSWHSLSHPLAACTQSWSKYIVVFASSFDLILASWSDHKAAITQIIYIKA